MMSTARWRHRPRTLRCRSSWARFRSGAPASRSSSPSSPSTRPRPLPASSSSKPRSHARMWTIDTPLANARRFLAGQPASHGLAKRLDMQRSSSHRLTQSFVGSAIRTVRSFVSYSDAEPRQSHLSGSGLFVPFERSRNSRPPCAHAPIPPHFPGIFPVIGGCGATFLDEAFNMQSPWMQNLSVLLTRDASCWNLSVRAPSRILNTVNHHQCRTAATISTGPRSRRRSGPDLPPR